MTARTLDRLHEKVAASLLRSAADRPTSCIILVDVPAIGFGLSRRATGTGPRSLADITFTEYDDAAADRMIAEVADAVERTTHVRPVVLMSSATIVAELDREQLRQIAQLDAVKRIGPNTGFTI